jgi:transposase
MTKQGKKFDTSFKLKVVRMIQEEGLSVQHVSQSMGIGLTAIRRWVAQCKAEQSGQRGIGNPLTLEDFNEIISPPPANQFALAQTRFRLAPISTLKF